MAIKKEDIIKKAIAASLIFLLLLSAVFVYTAWRGGHLESAEAMRGYLEKFGIWGPVVLAMIQALQVVLMLPGLFGFIAGSAMFGAFNGFVVNYIGVSAGSLMSYWLARQFGTSLVKKWYRRKNTKNG